MAEVTLATFTPPTAPVVPASGTPDAVPIAAVVCGVLAVYITALIVFFFVLRLVTKKCAPKCQCMECLYCSSCPSCKQCCLKAAECTDCQLPSVDTCLDTVCPSKQQCSLWCGGCRQWCATCCKLPDLSSLCSICPTLRCWSCQCSLQMPDCSNLTCLCIHCGGNGKDRGGAV